MLRALFSEVLRGLPRAWRGRRRRRARGALQEAMACCERGDYAAAGRFCEAAVGLAPDLADAHYALGLLGCHGGRADAGASSIERALDLAPAHPLYAAALADARLLQQREDDALALYARAYPGELSDMAALSDAGLPWKRAHPDWGKALRRVTLALPGPSSGAAGPGPIGTDEATACHLLNWALLLASRRRVREAIHLLDKAVATAPRLGYAHGALALLRTLNRDWGPALASAKAARALGAEAFAGANDLCVLAAQFGLGAGVRELDPVFDWSAFSGAAAAAARHLDLLPPIEGESLPQWPAHALVYFICCDTSYLMEHAIALVCSIRENASECAVHLHLFSPEGRAWPELGRLAKALAPLPLSVTWESVDFERYGGRSPYASCARFSRLYQMLPRGGHRIVMLDADSLVRGDLACALSQRGEIGLVHAPDEPMWHQYLAGFTTFRRSLAAERFLGAVSAFLACNLAAGRARPYMDQIGLYACAHRLGGAVAGAIDCLPVERFCDSLFHDDALVWSVTQNKASDSPFAQYRGALLLRYEGEAGPVTQVVTS